MYKEENEEEKNVSTKNIRRYWGCNDELRLLKWCTIKESELTVNDEIEIQENKIKNVVDENYNVLCGVYNKIRSEYINEREKITIEENKKLIKIESKTNNKIIDKEVNKYEKLFA